MHNRSHRHLLGFDGGTQVDQMIEGEKSSSAVADPASSEVRRQLALKQIARRRRFHMRAVGLLVANLFVCAIWAITEYHNAGGWPHSFSQSSGLPRVWNIWIIYPLLASVVSLGLDACFTYLWRPITESDLRREMERLT